MASLGLAEGDRLRKKIHFFNNNMSIEWPPPPFPTPMVLLASISGIDWFTSDKKFRSVGIDCSDGVFGHTLVIALVGLLALLNL